MIRSLWSTFLTRYIRKPGWICTGTVALIAALVAGSGVAASARGTANHAPTIAWQTAPVVMKWAEIAEPVSIDPAIANVDMDFNVTRNTYEGLTTYDTKTLHLEPALALSWSHRGRLWTFHLRPHVKFVDGTTFTANDVKASIDRMLKINQGEAYLISDVTGVKVVNPLTVDIATKAPDVYLPYNLAHIGIVSSVAIRKHQIHGDLAKKWFASHTDGTGPYTLQSWQHGTQLILVKNKHWWGHWLPGSVDKFIDLFVNDISTRIQGLQGGQYTMANYIPVADALRVGHSKGFKIVTGYENFSFPAIYFDTQIAPTNNLKLREALVKAFDYKAMIAYDRGLATTPRGPIPSFIPLSPENRLPPRTQDLSQAAQLVKTSGVTNPSITCAVPTGLAEFSYAATLFQADARQVGVTVHLENMPFAQFITAVHENKVQCSVLGEANLSPDPTQFFASHYITGAYYNLAHYSNPRFDRLVNQIRRTFNRTKRAALLYTACKMIADDYNTLWTVRPKLVWAMPKYVYGFTVDPTDYHIIRLADIRFARH